MFKEHQTRAIIVFGDIAGFGSFTQRISYPDDEFRPFIRQFYGMIDEFERKTKYFLKRLGDGFMCVVELPKKDGRDTAEEVINRIWNLNFKINTLISRKPTPRPEGFRSRVACGYIWKTVGDNNREDYLGYHVNLCEKILHVHKQETILFCQKFKELLSPDSLTAGGFKMKKMKPVENTPEGIYKEDLNSLWSLTKRK